MSRRRELLRTLSDLPETDHEWALTLCEMESGRFGPLPWRLGKKLFGRVATEPYRTHLIFSLRFAGTPRLSPELRNIAANIAEPLEARTAALEVLGHFRSRKNTRFLRACLEDPIASMRYWAASALGYHGSPSDLPKLDDMAQDHEHAIETDFWNNETDFGPVSEAAASAARSIRMQHEEC